MGVSAVVKIGCCGFQRSREKYYERFKLVEIQKTFYKPPRAETLRKWRNEAPKDFEFTVKAWMAFTHDPRSRIWAKSGLPREESLGLLRPTSVNLRLWDDFKALIRELEASVVVFQSPPSFKFSEGNLSNAREFFSSISDPDINLVWEVRNTDWPKSQAFKELLEDLGISHAVDPLFETPVYGRMRYYRLHGTRRGGRIVYSYKYSLEELRNIREVVYKWALSENYVLFNNSYFSFEDAAKLQEIMGHPK